MFSECWHFVNRNKTKGFVQLCCMEYVDWDEA